MSERGRLVHQARTCRTSRSKRPTLNPHGTPRPAQNVALVAFTGCARLDLCRAAHLVGIFSTTAERLCWTD
jgi:hypothetical protein